MRVWGFFFLAVRGRHPACGKSEGVGLDTLRERARHVSGGFVGSLEEIPAAVAAATHGLLLYGLDRVMIGWKLEGLGSEDEPVGGGRCLQDAFLC